MSVLIRAGILALGAVLLIPSGSARGEAAPQETLLLVVEAKRKGDDHGPAGW